MVTDREPGMPDEEFEDRVIRELQEMRGRIDDHERTLYGHEDGRRRLSEPGLVSVVSELASAFKDVRAVAKAGWAMLGLVGLSTMISLFTLFTRSVG